MVSVVHQGDNRYEIYRNGQNIGCISVRENEYHSRHAYLNIGLTEYDPRDAQELFSNLRTKLGKPMQVMTYSNKEEFCTFLTTGGFVRKRCCFEVCASEKDLIRPITSRVPLQAYKAGEDGYKEASRILYEHYISTHAAISPLTAGYEVFCKMLPEAVICQTQEGHILHLAFVEEEEIAYTASREPSAMHLFLESLLAFQLHTWKEVSFECDDCDPIALKLLAFFPQPKVSWDTYIFT